MLTRYLFKGKILDSGEWVVGQPLICRQKLFIVGNLVEACEEYCSPEYWYSVDPATIGQCTGLLAAKSYRGESEADRLIFEGDVVRYHNKYETHEGVVEWCNCQWVIRLSNGMFKLFSEIVVEIIGNIHDRKES